MTFSRLETKRSCTKPNLENTVKGTVAKGEVWADVLSRWKSSFFFAPSDLFQHRITPVIGIAEYCDRFILLQVFDVDHISCDHSKHQWPSPFRPIKQSWSSSEQVRRWSPLFWLFCGLWCSADPHIVGGHERIQKFLRNMLKQHHMLLWNGRTVTHVFRRDKTVVLRRNIS